MVSANTVLDRIRGRLDRTEAVMRRVTWISRLRIAVAAAGALVVAAAFDGNLAAEWIAAPVLVFVVLAILHERYIQQALRNQRVVRFHRRTLERMEADVSGDQERPRSPGAALRRKGVPGREDLEEAELLAARRDRVGEIGGGRIAGARLDEHLGLFGSAELFDRVGDHRTDAGGETLASWMLRPADPRECRLRQEAIQELSPRMDLREAVAATGSQSRWPARSGALSLWTRHSAGAPDCGEARAWREAEETGTVGPVAEAEGEPADPPRTIPQIPSPGHARTIGALIGALGLGNALGVTAWVAGIAGPSPLALSLMLSVLAGLLTRRLVRDTDVTLGSLVMEGDGLRRMAAILREGEFESELLARLREDIRDAAGPLRRLERIRSLFAVRRNLMFAPVAAPLFWGTCFALALAGWRRRFEPELARWSAASGAFDALLGLAQYADERPGDEYAEYDEEPGLAAVNLGHPLVPRERLARNSITLGRGDADFLIVTGSNMSGKSTLLRAIGANFVLARLGAPVTASRFRIGRLALGPSISSRDSLRDGVSRFLAELFALRAVLDAGAADAPLLCLLDEVLEGTNSSDRRVAVRALLEELGRRGAVGVLTTHDVSLTELARELPGRIRNMHFTEEIRDGSMRFDFRLRDGVLPRGNALELMKMLNLPAPGNEGADYTALPDSVSGKEN